MEIEFPVITEMIANEQSLASTNESLTGFSVQLGMM